MKHRIGIVVLIVLVLGLFTVGCGGPSTTSAPLCASGTSCDSECANFWVDTKHCGACGNACKDGEVCMLGECKSGCGVGYTDCNGGCHDTQRSKKHCGACGNACNDGEVCVEGACKSSCPQGEAMCGGTCAGPDTNSMYCGLNCSPGTTACGNDCVNGWNDPKHCGTCGNACKDGEVCTLGECKSACDNGLTVCGNGCFDLQKTKNHCGACGQACGGQQVCVAGQCQDSCPSGQTNCNGTCADLQSDIYHCGGCYRSCGFACTAGQCTESEENIKAFKQLLIDLEAAALKEFPEMDQGKGIICSEQSDSSLCFAAFQNETWTCLKKETQEDFQKRGLACEQRNAEGNLRSSVPEGKPGETDPYKGSPIPASSSCLALATPNKQKGKRRPSCADTDNSNSTSASGSSKGK